MSSTALLLMDFQNSIVERFGGAASLGEVVRVQQAAREKAIPIIYVVVKFRPGAPEISHANKAFKQVRAAGLSLFEGDGGAEIHESLAPQSDEIVVTKRRVSAFSGSDLDVVLRSLEVKHLILAGIATSGVVLSTLRAAADLDYQLTVLADCCFDTDDEVHRVLVEKIFPRQADVVTAVQWMAN